MVILAVIEAKTIPSIEHLKHFEVEFRNIAMYSISINRVAGNKPVIVILSRKSHNRIPY